jgi:hypothetical protein
MRPPPTYGVPLHKWHSLVITCEYSHVFAHSHVQFRGMARRSSMPQSKHQESPQLHHNFTTRSLQMTDATEWVVGLKGNFPLNREVVRGKRLCSRT